MEPVSTLAEVALSDFWERQAESWVRWAREPGHDTYWRQAADGGCRLRRGAARA